MFNITKKEIAWGGKTLVLETGRVARQADGAVIASIGGTYVLCTVVSAKKQKDDIDFFPLTVNYQEKAFAAGKIPGGFFKREGRLSEKETLNSRLIDRPIRPLFDEKFRHETQVVATVLSYDAENEPDVVALVGVAAALAISGVPFNGPIAGARVGYENGSYILNPSLKQIETSELDLMVAGTESSVLMVESQAKELSEDVMLGAVMFGHREFQAVIKGIKEFASEAGKPRWKMTYPETSAVEKRVRELGETGFRAAFKERQKQARVEKVNAVADKIVETLKTEMPEANKIMVKDAIKALESEVVRNDILDNKIRIDGRDEKTVRPIVCEVDVLPKTHGSSLFTRGETQALAVATLGSGDDEQILDALEGEGRQHFMLHYNFPPYSVGEATPMRPPGRREIGHGKLAWRALLALMPAKEEFPYTIRLVSEITESNGSSSMATVCSSSMALMDAGVPIKRPVAGIAMGLIKEGNKFSILSDIMGDEDHLGDMDFKVAGTENGVTALQMDIKINGITEEIMKIALAQANDGRRHILGEMAKVITSSRSSVNDNAPRLMTIKVPKDKIREVIGSGGKVIRDICERTTAKIDIDDDGTIVIAGANTEVCEAANKIIQDIVAEPEIGTVYDGTVIKIVDFGAFVNFLGARDGLLHISEIADYRVEQVTDVLTEGQKVKVKVIGMERGKVKLSMKVVNQETGEPTGVVSSSENSGGGRGEGGDRPRREGRGDRDRGDRPRREGRGDRDRGDRPRREGGDRDRGDRPRRDRDDRGGDRGPRRDRGERDNRGDRGPRRDREGGGRDMYQDNRQNPAYENDDDSRGNRVQEDKADGTYGNAPMPPKKKKKFWE